MLSLKRLQTAAETKRGLSLAMVPALRKARSGDAIMTQGGRVLSTFLILAPSLGRVAIINARLDRTIAAFACVEAIRAYAVGGAERR